MSGVFRVIDPHPLTARRVCTPPALVRGEDTLLGGEGVGGQYFGRRQTVLCTLYMYVGTCIAFHNFLNLLRSSDWTLPNSPHLFVCPKATPFINSNSSLLYGGR
jgi:hypothetical protein